MTLSTLWAYLRERFPPVNMALFAVVFLTVRAVARTVAGADAGPWGAADWAGIAATIAFFFRLRVFDEHKDFDLDTVNHPQRVLQRGLISLRDLRGLAWAGTAVEVGWSASQGAVVLAAWAVAAGYSLLMRYEFFVPAFLKPRLVLYAASHMLVMPLVIGWLWTAWAPLSGPGTERLALLAALSLLGGFAFEIARKTRAPAAERPTVDSYSRTLGLGRAIATVLALLTGGAVVQVALLGQLGANWWASGLIGSLLAATAAVYAAGWRRAEEALLRRAELLTSLFLLVSYVSVIVAAGK